MGLKHDATDYKLFANFKDNLQETILAEIEKIKELDLEVKLVQVNKDNAVEEIRGALSERTYDIIQIGAGIRTTPEHFLLFEKVVNLVHELQPQSKIGFNTGPDSVYDSAKRCLEF